MCAIQPTNAFDPFPILYRNRISDEIFIQNGSIVSSSLVTGYRFIQKHS